MNELQVFKNEIFGEIRTISVDGEPWFIANDVAAALGYSNTRDAIAVHVDEDDKNTVAIHDGTPGNPNQTVINESSVYSLIFGSQLESARAFKRWVTSEVLPSLRKKRYYTTYGTPQEAIAAIVRDAEDPERLPIIIEALQLADIDQSLFVAQLTGMTVQEFNRSRALIERSSENDRARRRLKNWNDHKFRIFTKADLPEKYRDWFRVKTLIDKLCKKSDCMELFADYCGTIYFTRHGYRKILEKMYRGGMITAEEVEKIEDEMDLS